jgi:hypothetical protein
MEELSAIGDDGRKQVTGHEERKERDDGCDKDIK